jgi:hypothetical protein
MYFKIKRAYASGSQNTTPGIQLAIKIEIKDTEFIMNGERGVESVWQSFCFVYQAEQ